MKRFLLILLGIVFLQAFPLSAQTIQRDGMVYEFDDYGQCHGRYDGHSSMVYVVQYLSYGDYVYEPEIDPDFSNQTSLEEISFSFGCPFLEYDFSGCTNLRSVQLPLSVTYIDRRMFYDCPKLDLSTVLTENIQYLSGDECFALSEPTNCGTFDYPTIKTSLLAYDCFRNRQYTDVVSYDSFPRVLDLSETKNLTVYGEDYWYYDDGLPELTKLTAIDCKRIESNFQAPKLETVIVKGKSTRIALGGFSSLSSVDLSGINGKFEDEAFPFMEIHLNNCPLIKEVTIPDACTYLSVYNMEGLTSLSGCKNVVEANVTECPLIQNLSFPGIERIGRDGFSYNDSLKEVYFGASLKEVENDGVFYKCKNLEDLIYEGSLEQWLDINFSFDESSAGSAMLARVPNFWYGHGNTKHTKLTELNTSNVGSADKISRGAFMGYKSLTSVSLPSSVKKICDSAFSACSGLKEINIDVERIEQWAFFGDKALENIQLGNNLQYIGPAFSQPTEKFNVNYHGSQKEWGKVKFSIQVFEDCEDTSEAVGVARFGTPYLIQFADNFYFNNVLLETLTFDEPEEISEAYARCQTLQSVVINCGDKYPKISNRAFYNCAKLKSVKYTKPTRSNGDDSDGFEIGAYAFANCFSLSEIEILDNIKSIGNLALEGTPWLKACPQNEVLYLETERGTTAYTYVGTAPEGCHLEIKEGTEAINEKAFYGDGTEAGKYFENITTVSLPSTLKYVGYEAFGGTHLTGNLTIPASVEYFAGSYLPASNFKNIKFEDSDKSLEGYEQFFVKNAESVYFGRNLESFSLRTNENVGQVIYGPMVTEVNSGNAIATNNVYSLAIEPPHCNVVQRFSYDTWQYEDYYPAFDEIDYNTCVLHVLPESLEKYRSADGWKEFQNIVGDATEDASVQPISIAGLSSEAIHYDIMGRIIRADEPGMHIVVTKDGTSGKVLVK